MAGIQKLCAASIAIAALCLSPNAFSEVSVPPFYEASAKIKPEGKLGQIVKKEKVATPISGAQAWRIAYISSDVNDRKTISTGLLISPVGKAPKEGRPIVSWSHGTTGSAQNCGPSQQLNPAVDLNEYYLTNGNSWTDYGVLSLTEFIKEGYVVVATDYQGLGGGGKHQYTVGKTQARDAINAIRAAGSVKEIGTNKKALIYGWSQGGYATLTAASSNDYVAQKGTVYDDIELVGIVALSPVNMSGVMQEALSSGVTPEQALLKVSEPLSQNMFDWAHLASLMWGIQAANPETLKLTEWFTPEGAKVFNEVSMNKCFHVLSDSLNYAYGTKYKTLMNPVPANAKAWADAMIAGGIANVKPSAPVLMFRGTNDAVPKGMVDIYQGQMCKMGANVQHIELAGATHFSSPVEAQRTFLPWVKDRFTGKPLANACAGS